MWIAAPNLRAAHGFSTREGGVSAGPWAGLNLDDRAGSAPHDRPVDVAENRRRALARLGVQDCALSQLDQVHGLEVVQARGGTQQADAQVTDQPGLLLAVLSADCYPLLLEDPEAGVGGAGVLGAAHAGWRGTVGRIGERTVRAMVRLGARPERIRAAVGPGICAGQYRVGPEVAARFAATGLGAHVRETSAGPQLDLAGANRQVLLDAGVAEAHLWTAGLCSTDERFYSYRRDGGVTGRMWAVVGQPTRGGAA